MREAVCIGVATHAEPARLVATVRSVRASTGADVRFVLLPDAPDVALSAALASDPELTAIEQWGTTQPRGMAACFNRLASCSGADVVVLLESGVVVGPRWLRLMLAALERSGCGLAGPSTNMGWNEQAIRGCASGDEASVRRDAASALRRFGTAARTLAPLYSLADFCYAVRREVIDAIGPADEAYGIGPCWEMDYNIRAARAGFHGVWVGAAYVYRSPPTDRRRDADATLMAANRRLYQDRFCGLRLRGETAGYREHCLGDGCEHFAPSGRPEVMARPVPVALTSPPAAAPASSAVAGASPHGVPLVSCIMPTRERPDLARQAVSYFLRQDHPNTELVIVEDGRPLLAGALPDDPRIRLVASDTPRSTGVLRNLACEHARGEIIVQWDDDDWYGDQRLSRQIADIAANSADITALRDALVFDLEGWRFWRFTPPAHRRAFVRDVHGGTLAFRRTVWERLARYPDASLAEDAALLDRAVRRGARLRALGADGLFVYVRHGTNSWRFVVGEAEGLVARPEPEWLAPDRAFYAVRSSRAPSRPPTDGSPLVSCIMPTMDRPRFVSRAIEYFRRQDYAEKELVILDDGSDPVADLIPDDPAIVYRRLEHRVVLGAKRNLACAMARGEIIAHWDDDDWHAPHRLSTQVARLVDSGADVCGCRSLRFYDVATSQAWRYELAQAPRIWAAGSSLLYTRDLWIRSPFPAVATGEDTRFVWSRQVRSMCDVSAADILVAIIHRSSTVPKNVHGAHWTEIPSGEVERLLGADLAFYLST